nr:MAG TPA: hypothetical protein [Crassvirales sp.]
MIIKNYNKVCKCLNNGNNPVLIFTEKKDITYSLFSRSKELKSF